MSAFESAIDDSFDPAPQLAHYEEHEEDGLFDNAYQGPRVGRWDVSSSVGSFIDDRSPTVFGYQHRPSTNRRGAPIDEGLAKRLMQATIEERRATAIAASKNEPLVDRESNAVSSAAARSEAKAPKPFFVPQSRSRSYTPVNPDASIAMNENTGISKADLVQPKHIPISDRGPTVPADHTTSPAASRQEAALLRPDLTPSTSRTIRILGKNGEVAYVDLPSLPKTYPEASSSVRPTTVNVDERQKPTAPIHQASLTPDQQSGNNTPTDAAPRVSDTPTGKQTHGQGNPWVTPSPAKEPGRSIHTPSVIMSGALPMPFVKASAAPQSAKNSAKDSGIVMGDTPAFGSRAGSRTIIPSKHGSTISQGVSNFAQQVAKMPSTSGKKPRSVPAAPAPQMFEEVGVGVTTGFPAKRVANERHASTAEHEQHGSRQVSQRSFQRVSRQVSPDHVHHFGGSMALSLKSTRPRNRPEVEHSNYRPPTVRSGSSSSSITHTFGGFLQNDLAQQMDDQIPDHHSNSKRSSHCRRDNVQERVNGASVSPANAISANVRDAYADVHPKAVEQTFTISDCVSPPTPSHSPVSPLAPSYRPSPLARQPTKFAGDGWISPHPLSVASSDAGAAPQPEVHIYANRSGHRAVLTYDEWRAQRDAANSISGSFAGSRIPSAVGAQIATSIVYNHPPPASYVGSYEHKTVRPYQPPSRVGEFLARSEGHNDRKSMSQEPVDHALSLQEQRKQRLANDTHGSVHSRGSFHTHIQSSGTAHNSSVYSGSRQRVPSINVQDEGWAVPPKYGGSAPGSRHASARGYNVGLTPAELADYQRQLGSTISCYTSHLSRVQEEQVPPQPDYNIWNVNESHASGHAVSHHSSHAFPANLSYPHEKTHLAMPWDQASTRSRSSSTLPDLPRSQRASPSLSRHYSTGNALETGSTPLGPRGGDYGSEISRVSHSTVKVPHSQVTYGTAEWQDLENAEDGHGKFESRQNYRSW